MLETPMQALIAAMVLGMIAIILVPVGGLINSRKKFVSKQVFDYIYSPLMLLPVTIVLTYIFLPKGSVNFAVRLLVSIGMLIIAALPVYPMSPLIESMYIKFTNYSVQEDEESNE